jgi:iron complex outermembrane receptor protein
MNSAIKTSFAALLAASSSPVFAADVEAGDPAEILVTAQRRAQSALDVPIAVTVFGQAGLDDLQVNTAADLQRVIPNFSFTPTNFGGTNFTIRGIGASVLGDGAETGVALHYNGVFLQSGGSTSLYYDLEALEVLRGPQGTLFGRNATAGAVNLRTRQPTDDLEGQFEVTLGERRGHSARGAINLPLGTNIALRIAMLAGTDDGDTRNLTTGNRINGNEVLSGRVSLRLDIGERTKVTANATWSRISGDIMQANKQLCARDAAGSLGCRPDRLGFDFPNNNATLTGQIANAVGLLLPGRDPFVGSSNPADLRTVALDFDPRADTRTLISMVEITHDFGGVTLTNLASYSKTTGFFEYDPDFAVAAGQFRSSQLFPGGLVPASQPDTGNLGSLAGLTLGTFNRPWSFTRGDSRSRQWLNEIRLASDWQGQFNFLLGALYLDSRNAENLYNIANSLDAAGLLLEAAPPFFRLETPVADLSSFGIFGEAYIGLNNTAKLTLGARWTRDRKTQANRNLLLNLPLDFESNRLEDRALTGRAVIDWQPNINGTDATLFYLSFARGFKGGGFNPQGAVSVKSRFAPEFVNAIEVGGKVQIGGLNLAASAFHYDYNGLQVSRIVNRTSINDNINARIWGAELELTAQVNRLWRIDLTASHLSTRIGEVNIIDPRDPSGGVAGFNNIKDIETGANCVATDAELQALRRAQPFANCVARGFSDGNAVSLAGKSLANAPGFTARLGSEIKLPVGQKLQARLRADYSWRSKSWGRVFNRDPVDRIASWGSLTAVAEVSAISGSWYVRGEVANLLNKTVITGIFVTDATAGLATNLFLLPPRRFSIVAGTRF